MAIETRIVRKVGDVEIGIAESTLAGRYTQEELEAAFDLVKNPAHWKGEINAAIHPSRREVVAAAIEHFTGTEATFVVEWSWYLNREVLRVKSPGYWGGPCN